MNENVKNMAKAIIPVYVDWKKQEDFSGKKTIDLATTIATVLDKAGYRKQREVVKEFAERLTKRLTKEVEDNPEAAASQYKAGLYFAMDLAEQYGKEEK